jgi:D-alanyl-lipoteichoic acid acyltransferase DltB (MBOAT superfamily)
LFGKEFHPVNLNIILPIGLSFHTFQSMSYTIEVYRRNQRAERHLGLFANYVLFFPQMVAGPIERYDRLGNELRQVHFPLYENFAHGFRLILFGLFVKMTIADNIAPYVNNVYAAPLEHRPGEVVAAIFLFSFQIYADFYGYSTIAVGCARLLGITIMDNFKTPYLARDFSEFWSRWHISLSTWFRDYLYIPLGGNRVSTARWAINILLVFMISGLWHGASWTFVVWGALHGIMLLIERFFKSVTGIRYSEEWSLMNIFRVIKTFLLTSFFWIFFRAESFSNAKEVIGSLLAFSSLSDLHFDEIRPWFYIILLVMFDVYVYNRRFDTKLATLKWPVRWTFYSVLLFCLMALSGTKKYAFIYFQF